jgi:hypothetical protein
MSPFDAKPPVIKAVDPTPLPSPLVPRPQKKKGTNMQYRAILQAAPDAIVVVNRGREDYPRQRRSRETFWLSSVGIDWSTL